MVTAPPQLLHDSYILHDFLIMFFMFLINNINQPSNSHAMMLEILSHLKILKIPLKIDAFSRS